MTAPPITLSWADRLRRPAPFEPQKIFATLRARPLRPMVFADGHLGWLATGYDVVREVPMKDETPLVGVARLDVEW